MKYHDNNLKIVVNRRTIKREPASFTKKGYFKVTDYCVTDGQDPDGRISRKTYDVGTDGNIKFQTGRRKTSEVADWWKERIPRKRNTFHTDPKGLNFAMTGDLVLYVKGKIFGNDEVELTLKDIAFAQGYNGIRNNWWFGAKEGYYHVNNQSDVSGDNIYLYGTYKDKSGNKGIVKTIAIRHDDGSVVNEIVLVFDEIIRCGNAAWMNRLLGNSCPLRKMKLPGSHDAGMSELHHVNILAELSPAAVQTQNACIYEQLLYGCRYFDIRVDYDHDELVTYHRSKDGIGAGGQSVEDIFDQAVCFLREYPSETCILKISHLRDCKGHHKEDIFTRLLEFIKKYKDYFYTRQSESEYLLDLTYEKLRGKILIVYTISGCTANGKYLFHYDDVAFKNCPISRKENRLFVYDEYSNEDNYERMKRDQLEKWSQNKEYLEKGSYHLFLLSWTLTVQKSNLFNSNYDMAKEANKGLPDILKEKKKEGWPVPNIVYIDYVAYDVCNEIIKYNG